MKLKIQIFPKRGSRRELILSPESAQSTYITVSAHDEVQAEVHLSKDELGHDYIVQAGKQPDVRGFAERCTGKRVLQFAYWDRRGGIDVKKERMKLFQGTIGVCFLFVREFDSSDQGRSPRIYPMAMVLVIDQGKGGLYDRMVAEILDMDLPHFCLDDFKGQMYKNRFTLSFREGYTSYEDQDVMLKALCNTLKDITPLLGSIALSPQEKFIKSSKRAPMSSLRRVDGCTRKALQKAFFRFGSENLSALNDVHVSQTRKVSSLDIPSHRVIKWYLEQLLRRCSIIEDGFVERVARCEKESEKFLRQASKAWERDSMGLVAKSGNQWAEEKANVEGLKLKIAKCLSLRTSVRALMSMEVVRDCTKTETIFAVPASEFASNQFYQCLHRKMLEFMRQRFWWVGDTDSAICTLPEFKMSDDGESLLQTKYSLVYENWCYARLINAFKRIGFSLLSGGSLDNKDGSYCLFEKDGLSVQLIHGIRAEKRRPKDIQGEMFICEDQGRSLLTPDFALVFGLDGKAERQWMVLDAKSDAVMKDHMINKRNQYAGGITYTTDGQDRIKPFACMLVWSGENEDMFPGVEMPLSHEYRYHKGEGRGPVDDYSWRGDYGIEVGEDGYPTFHGHLRVNVKSAKMRPNIFDEFVDGISKTARRLLGM